MMSARWEVQAADPVRAQRLAHALRVHPITAQLLLNRGMDSEPAARRFLHPTLRALDDPAAIPDLDRAVARLRLAIARREPIVLFSDSDVDGLTASVILFEALRACGADVRAIPSNRIDDGYGLPSVLVEELTTSRARLLVLVDCGTNQAEEVARLGRAGVETIIVDHHVPLERWAQPVALVNPHCGDGAGRELCSAGLALKLAQALLEAGARVEAWLDLAALGTLADCSRLIGDSRVLVAEGLPRIVRSHRPGLARLCEATGTSLPDPEHVVRRLIPRLNASGRLGDARAIWELLREEPEGSLDAWLEASEEAHDTTKALHRRILAEAQEQVGRMHFRDAYVVVVSRRGWHQGLMGPVASQLANRYGRPAIALAMGERQGVGSGRSVPMLNLLEALRACEGLLVRFGGHAQACGLTVEGQRVEEFRALVNEQAKRLLGPQGLVRTQVVDVELPLEALQGGWVEEVERLAPFGYGNPRPTMLVRGVTLEVVSSRVATLSRGRVTLTARGSFAMLVSGGHYDVVGSPVTQAGVLALSVSDARASTEPAAPAPTSGTTCTRAPG